MKRLFVVSIIVIMMLSTANTYATELSSDDTNNNTESVTITEPNIDAQAAIVINSKTGQVVYEKNANSKQYPASITKIMTALLALEEGNPNDNITFSEDAIWGIDRDSSHIALDVDEVISFEDCLNAILIVSANEASVGMAEYIGGTSEGFASMMNQRATELGCLNTNFTNSNGLPSDDHYTSAYDMALITKKALEFDTFRDIAGSLHYVIEPTNKQPEQRDLRSHNKLLLEETEYYYEYCEGGKTGYTNQAQGTLVTWSKKDNVEYICVIMNTPPTSIYTDSIALYNYVYDAFVSGTPISNYTFNDSDYSIAKGLLDSSLGQDISVDNIDISVDFSTPVIYKKNLDLNALTATTSYLSQPSGDVIGKLTYSYDGIEQFSYAITASVKSQLVTSGAVKPKKDKSIFDAIKVIFIVLLVIVVLGIAWLLYMKQLNEKRRRKSIRQRK